MTCSSCGASRTLSQLIEVRSYRTGAYRYVCRPGIEPRCFGTVGPASDESIAAADRMAERAGFAGAAWPERPLTIPVPEGGTP